MFVFYVVNHRVADVTVYKVAVEAQVRVKTVRNQKKGS